MRKYLITAIILTIIIQSWAVISQPKVRLNSKDFAVFEPESPFCSQEKNALSQEIIPESQDTQVFAAAAEPDLELTGTAVGSKEEPIAWIKDLNSGVQKTYKTGNRIGQGVIIRIAKGSVDYQINGSLRTLKLQLKSKGTSLRDSAIIGIEGDNITISRSGLISEYSQIAQSVRQIQVRPYSQDKKIAGMKVDRIPKESIIANAGFRNKDVITMVNGLEIKSYQKALQVLGKVRNESDIKVTLLREGQVKELAYHIAN